MQTATTAKQSNSPTTLGALMRPGTTPLRDTFDIETEAEFDPSKHKRDPKGRFSPKGTGTVRSGGKDDGATATAGTDEKKPSIGRDPGGKFAPGVKAGPRDPSSGKFAPRGGPGSQPDVLLGRSWPEKVSDVDRERVNALAGSFTPKTDPAKVAKAVAIGGGLTLAAAAIAKRQFPAFIRATELGVKAMKVAAKSQFARTMWSHAQSGRGLYAGATVIERKRAMDTFETATTAMRIGQTKYANSQLFSGLAIGFRNTGKKAVLVAATTGFQTLVQQSGLKRIPPLEQRLRESGTARTRIVECLTPIREAKFSGGDDGKATARVILITEGPGNRANRNFYPADALRKSFRVFEGEKCFLDHPSVSEEEDRPERSVREICGWFSECEIGTVDGKAAIVANLHFSSNEAGTEARNLIESALRYESKYSGTGKVLCGFSINAEGPSHEDILDEESWNIVEGIDNAVSADLVTFPARGGKALSLMEADRCIDSWRFRRELAEQLESRRWRREFARTLRKAA